jgi:FtsP/CotA-like multicopper oxidase with cupredoxin domain
VRWHVVAFGTEFHVFHVHGHRWRAASGRHVDAEVLGPATSLVADWVEDNPGEWLYHCHVVDHMVGGMVGNYVVTR